MTTSPVLAQGQDSTPTERNALVIAELLSRVYDNYNQVYFDRRIGYPEDERHDRLEIRVNRVGGPDSMLLSYREFAGGDYSQLTRVGALALAPDNERQATRMEIWDRPVDGLDPMDESGGVTQRPEGPPDCVVYWTREAAQFRGHAEGECPAWASESVLGQQQMWLTAPGGRAHPGGTYKLHAARMMSCYIDVPGVSGGRDEEYKRYDGLMVHDRGGSARITTNDGMQLGIRLSNVDWPLNNYNDAFTRDVLVLYVLEYKGDEIKSHGYILHRTESRAYRHQPLLDDVLLLHAVQHDSPPVHVMLGARASCPRAREFRFRCWEIAAVGAYSNTLMDLWTNLRDSVLFRPAATGKLAAWTGSGKLPWPRLSWACLHGFAQT